MTLVIATNNSHKLKEFKEILPEFTIVSPSDISIMFEHEETESSFAMNAVGKATTLWQLLHEKAAFNADFMVLADDSGLVVPALGGAPGVYSARYGAEPNKPQMSDNDRNLLLLENMKMISNRSAYYVCCMALVRGTDKFDCIQETWEGIIARSESTGKGGFGYDPLFFLPEYGCTVADLANGLKSQLSHRAKAIKRLVHLLK